MICQWNFIKDPSSPATNRDRKPRQNETQNKNDNTGGLPAKQMDGRETRGWQKSQDQSYRVATVPHFSVTSCDTLHIAPTMANISLCTSRN
jgi:hypothetical protein